MQKIPMQQIPTAEKLKITDGGKVPEWIKQNRDFFINNLGNVNTEEIEKLYSVLEDIIDNEYTYLTNPLNSTDSKYKNMPASLKDYNIIKPVVNRFLGERRRRPNKFSVVPIGDDVVNAVREKEEDLFKKALEDRLLFILQAKGILSVDGEEPSKEEKIERQKISNKALNTVVEELALDGQNALEFLSQELDLDNKFQEAFYHFIVAGSVFDFKTIENNNIEYNIVKPSEIEVINWDERSPYAEDAFAIIRNMYWSKSSIIDVFNKYLDKDCLDWLDSAIDETPVNTSFGVIASGNGEKINYTTGNFLIQHIVWKTSVKRGILTYESILGVKEMPVDETYKLNKKNGDIKIEWKWENEWWEIYCLCKNTTSLDKDVKYIKWGRGEVQRTDLNNTSVCKLPYNGVKYGYTDRLDSIVKTGINYQKIINVLYYRFELALNRSYEKMLSFPISLIPKQKGWNTERWLYTMRAFSIVMFDDTADKAASVLSGLKEIDMSLGNYMERMYTLIQIIKNEYREAVGFNNQRFGDVGAREGKAVTEYALSQASKSTNDIVAKFESFREKSLEGLLDYSKFAFLDGKKGTYFKSDRSAKIFEINGIQHATRNYGVFVVDPISEQEKLDLFKNMLLQPLAQNNTDPEILAGIIETDSFEKVKQLTRQAKELADELEMELRNREEELKKYVADTEAQTEQKRFETQMLIAKERNDTEIKKALIMADSFNNKEGDSDGNGIPESQEIIDNYLDITRKINSDNDKARLARQQQESKERIANLKNKEDANN